jgi:hypothetical protein
MKFEEAFALMREGVKCRNKIWGNKKACCFIKDNILYVTNNIKQEMGEARPFDEFGLHLKQEDLFGEWEVYYETNS